MIRILVFAIIVLAFALGFSWFADRPGELSLIWQGQLFQTPLTTALALMIGLIFVVLFVWWLISAIWTSPNSVRRYFRARKRDRGYQAISTGLIAAGAGDLITAQKMSTRSHALLSSNQEPLIHVLDAQVALIEGNHDKARKLFETMAEDPETQELGLRGLYLEAKRVGAEEAASQFAERAANKAPYLLWAAQATLENRTRQGRWDDAIHLLDQQRSAKVTDKKNAARIKAVLLTARAESKLERDPKGAAADALQALKLRGDFHPAAIIAAKAYLTQGSLRKSSSILEAIWKKEPHPQTGALYIRARGGDTVIDRLKRAEKLEALNPDNAVSLLMVARAALDARAFSKARDKAEASARIQSFESAFLLLADVEEAETGDQGRIRHWMAQALRAQRDPTWVADGLVSQYWRPLSPTTGKLDAFEWKIPYGEIKGPVEEGFSTPLDAALESLPPMRKDRPTEKQHAPETTPPSPVTKTTLNANTLAKTEKMASSSEIDQVGAPTTTPVANVAKAVGDYKVEETASVIITQDKITPGKASDEKPKIITDDDLNAEEETGNKRRDPVLSPFGGRNPDDPGVAVDDAGQPLKRTKRSLF